MPSTTVSLNDDQYQHVLETIGEDQSKSARLRELIDKGIQAERNNE